MNLKLTHITIEGTMQGPIWWPAGEVCETCFDVDFAAPKAPHSPWQKDWSTLDEALQEALSCGDFQGGMGDLVYGQITFHLAGNGRSKTISRSLEDLAAAQPYLAS